ncbi:MAG: SDR family oxidoreductase [Bryobacteraceae bacterium]|nr:SDR family oxidoreductase [Bryobacteraceae bacterium]
MSKTALITGASSGIGLELARIHAETGGHLVLVARRRDRLDALKVEIEEAHGVSVTVIAEDLTDADAPCRIHRAVTELGIEVDYLVNNAGLGARGLFHEMPWDKALAMIQVNAIALAGLTRAFLPGFVARNSGRILNVTSTASEMPGPLQAVYFATKGFAAYLSNALVEELRDTSVSVTNFMPTATATEFAAVAGMDGTALFRNTATARAVAKDGYDAMLRGDMDAYGGMTFKRRVMQIVAKSMPKRAALRAVRRAQEAN